MTDKIVASLKEQNDKLVAAAGAFNALNVANVEKLVELELGSVRELSGLAISQLKAAVEVKDVDGLKAYADSHAAYVRQVSEKLTADSQAVAELAKTYTADVQKIAQESVDAVAKVA